MGISIGRMNASPRDRLAVFGIGNQLMGDDGIGVLVARRLSRQSLAGVEVIEAGAPGFGLMDMIAPRSEAIFIDAVDAGLSPGSVFWVDPAAIVAYRSRQSLHQVGLADILSLMEVAGGAARVRIIGIQPERVGAAADITDSLRRRLPVITDRAADMIKAWMEDGFADDRQSLTGEL